MTPSGSVPEMDVAARVRTARRGRYVTRAAESAADLHTVEALRARSFRRASTRDAFDAIAQHVMVEDKATGALVCCYRLMEMPAEGLPESHAALHYDIRGLMSFEGSMLELGRFCMHPGAHDPDILRAAWAAMTDLVDRRGIRLLFGCTSFAGTDPTPYRAAFGLLAERYLAPASWGVERRAREVIDLGEMAENDRTSAMRAMPPLLRTYLLMGGRVSDHAVVDREMETLHVFTGLEIGAIPEARKRLLRALV